MYIELAPTYSPGASTPVPSALMGLTTLFGMGRGGTPSLKAPTFLYPPWSVFGRDVGWAGSLVAKLFI